MSRTEVEAFFTEYRNAFDRLDGDAVADFWHVPSGVADGRGLTLWSDDAPMRANHHARTPRGPRVLRCTGFEEDLKEMRRDAAQ